jgi:HD-like signal output (HDOD) protein
MSLLSPTITSAGADAKSLVRDAIRKVQMIATLPEVTTQIIKTVEDPRSTASQLHRIVSHDPALVTRILKVVNSAFYGLPGQIASVERAIVLLGLNAIKNIAVAASLGQMFRGVKLTETYTAKDLWTHCIAVGVMCRALAKELKLPFADEAFLSGIIHDIGFLLNMQTAPEKLRQVCKLASQSPIDFCKAEREIIGVDHQQLGQGLCEHWRFPKICQAVAGHHHTPEDLEAGDDIGLMVRIVWAADTACCQNGFGFNLTAQNQQLEDAQLEAIGLSLAAVDRIAQDMKNTLADAMTVLGA